MWRNIKGFSAYEVSEEGIVRKKSTGLILKPSNRDRVRLIDDDGFARRRSVIKLLDNSIEESEKESPEEQPRELDRLVSRSIRYTVNRIIRFRDRYLDDFNTLWELVNKSKANLVKTKIEEKKTSERNKLLHHIECLEKKIEEGNTNTIDKLLYQTGCLKKKLEEICD